MCRKLHSHSWDLRCGECHKVGFSPTNHPHPTCPLAKTLLLMSEWTATASSPQGPETATSTSPMSSPNNLAHMVHQQYMVAPSAKPAAGISSYVFFWRHVRWSFPERCALSEETPT